MAYKRKYKSSGRTYKRRRTYKRTYKRNLSKVVKKVLRRQLETKSNQSTPGTLYIYQTITNNEVNNLVPFIAQGVGQADRIGNKITPTRFVVKLAIFCNNMNAVVSGASSSYFDIYIFKYKPAQLYNGQPTATDMAKFLQNDNTTDSYNGQVLDGLRPVNSDIFQLLVQKRILLNNIYQTGVLNMSGAYQSTSPQRTMTINLTKHVKKIWSYDDTNNFPTNDNLYIAIGSTQSDGNTLGASVVGSYHMITHFDYKDA